MDSRANKNNKGEIIIINKAERHLDWMNLTEEVETRDSKEDLWEMREEILKMRLNSTESLRNIGSKTMIQKMVRFTNANIIIYI
jgi:hypothetical protein